MYFFIKGEKFIIQLDFNLNQTNNFTIGTSLRGTYFDLETNKLFVALTQNLVHIYEFDTNETTLNSVLNVTTSESPRAITVFMDKFFIGSQSGKIISFNKSTGLSINATSNMCNSSQITSVKFDYIGNMIYTCEDKKLVNILSSSQMNLLNKTTDFRMDTYLDWWGYIGGGGGFVIFA